jgi:transposase
MEKNIPLLPWPGNSPDLNPIENLWSIVKRRIRSENITTKLQLIDRLISVWHRDEEVQKICISAIESMPRRINAVINAKGGPTKYYTILYCY